MPLLPHKVNISASCWLCDNGYNIKQKKVKLTGNKKKKSKNSHHIQYYFFFLSPGGSNFIFAQFLSSSFIQGQINLKPGIQLPWLNTPTSFFFKYFKELFWVKGQITPKRIFWPVIETKHCTHIPFQKPRTLLRINLWCEPFFYSCKGVKFL